MPRARVFAPLEAVRAGVCRLEARVRARELAVRIRAMLELRHPAIGRCRAAIVGCTEDALMAQLAARTRPGSVSRAGALG